MNWKRESGRREGGKMEAETEVSESILSIRLVYSLFDLALFSLFQEPAKRSKNRVWVYYSFYF
jgi:hypothetical protein